MWRRDLWPWRRLILVPKESYKRLADLEARLADLAGEAMQDWAEQAQAIMSQSELAAFDAHAHEQAKTGETLPVPAELQPLLNRMMTDETPPLAEVRNRAGWFVAGRDWGQVWRALV